MGFIKVLKKVGGIAGRIVGVPIGAGLATEAAQPMAGAESDPVVTAAVMIVTGVIMLIRELRKEKVV